MAETFGDYAGQTWGEYAGQTWDGSIGATPWDNEDVAFIGFPFPNLRLIWPYGALSDSDEMVLIGLYPLVAVSISVYPKQIGGWSKMFSGELVQVGGIGEVFSG